jgi:hypothetical protein
MLARQQRTYTRCQTTLSQSSQGLRYHKYQFPNEICSSCDVLVANKRGLAELHQEECQAIVIVRAGCVHSQPAVQAH